METLAPTYLIFLNTQVPAPFWSYDRNRAWLTQRGMAIIKTVGMTAHAVLIHTKETQSEIEDAMRETLHPEQDSFRVLRVRDFDWPSALPDDHNTLVQWLESRGDWREWRAGH